VSLTIGPNVEGLIIAILARRRHPEQGFRTCMGILQLCKPLEISRAESVAGYALAVSALNVKSVASILTHNLDLAEPAQDGMLWIKCVAPRRSLTLGTRRVGLVGRRR
jgi:hypothetical protein